MTEWDREKVRLLLEDLSRFVDEANYLCAKGKDAYSADSMEGIMMRNAGERIVIKVATVIERLPQPFKDSRPDIPWADVQRMRNLIAHHYSKVNSTYVWYALEKEIPGLVADLGLRP